jgi:Uma2 family endonuclease
VTKRLTKDATYADLCALPEHFVAEILGGELYAFPRPASPHAYAAPDWLCEVLSPSTEAVDRRKKLAIYAAAGVGHVWLLNPLLQTLEILRLESQRWSLVVTHEADAKVRAEPFHEIELPLRALWL